MRKRNNPGKKHEPSLPSDRAFVVQFHAEADTQRGSFKGRVEHLVSGQAQHFHSQEQLLTFMRQILTDAREKPP